MARVVKCPKCGELGSLQPKKTKHGIYWRVGHYRGLKGKTRKIKWCYIGKELPETIKKQLFTQSEQLITQEFTQSDVKKNNLKLSPNDEISLKRHTIHNRAGFQSDASSELNRLFQTTQQDHPTLWDFIKNVVARLLGQLNSKPKRSREKPTCM